MRRCADDSSSARTRNSRLCPSKPSNRPTVPSIATGCPATSRSSWRLAKQLRQSYCQPLSSVPSDPFLPRAAIAVAKGAQRSLEQWNEKLDGVQVFFHGFAVALLASTALSDELRRHFQHASAQLQRELGVSWPVYWRLAFAHLPELRLRTVCTGLEEQVDHVASLLRSLLCHCVVVDEQEKPLVHIICCHPLHKGRLGIARRSKARQSCGLVLARTQGVNKLPRATTPPKVLQREGHWELLEQDHGHHLGRIHKQSLLACLGKVDEPQRVTHINQDVAAVEVAVLMHAQGLVVRQPRVVSGLQQTLKLLKQAHEGLARVFVAPHSRVAVVDQAVLEFLCVAAHLADAAVQHRGRRVPLCQIRVLCTVRHAKGEDERSDDATQGTFDEPFRLCCESIGAPAGLERKRAQWTTRPPQLLHHSHHVCVDLKTGLRCELPDDMLLESGDQLGI
eukprot:scaffold45582_cov70-Phaeocystis_antarctica.AAC.1